jgi:RNA polymerase sigma-70 factor (ECF subfamily)
MDANRSYSDLSRVYEENVWHVYGFLAYRLRDRETAEDLTQVTFERATRAFSRFDPRRASERTWLLAIARNALIDHQRRGRRLSSEPLDEGALSPAPGPEDAIASVDLRAALMQLPDREREVLALRYGAEMTGPEIAGLLGLSAANVHQIISRTLRKLRAELDPRAASPSEHAGGLQQPE